MPNSSLFALKRRADRNLGARRAFLSGKVVSAVSFHGKRTAENHRRGYSLRSATLGSTATALRAGKVAGKEPGTDHVRLSIGMVWRIR